LWDLKAERSGCFQIDDEARTLSADRWEGLPSLRPLEDLVHVRGGSPVRLRYTRPVNEALACGELNELSAIGGKERVGRHDDASSAAGADRGKRPVKLRRVPRVEHVEPTFKVRAAACISCTSGAAAGFAEFQIAEICDTSGAASLSSSSHFPPKPAPPIPEGDAGDVASRTRETRHDARSDRVDQACEHDRDGCGHPVGGERALCRADHENVDLQPDHLGDEFGKAFGPPFRESCLDDDILPLNVPYFLEPWRNAWIAGPGETGETNPMR
jgi:hypothetical protein